MAKHHSLHTGWSSVLDRLGALVFSVVALSLAPVVAAGATTEPG